MPIKGHDAMTENTSKWSSCNRTRHKGLGGAGVSTANAFGADLRCTCSPAIGVGVSGLRGENAGTQ